jgi:hypothetical protein
VLVAVLQVLHGDGAHQRVGRVAVGEQRADGQQHLGDGERRTPVVLEDVQADDPLAVDVAVVDARLEHHLQHQSMRQGMGFQALRQGMGFQDLRQGMGFQALRQGMGFQDLRQEMGFQALILQLGL